MDAVGGRATVIAGTGTYDTAASVELSRRAAAAGVAGLMAVTPYYSKPEQRGIAAHMLAIANSTDLPLLVYNIPGRTGRRIDVSTLEEIARHPQVVATKDAVMDLDFTSDTVQRVPHLTVYSGQDSYTLPMMSVGAVGVVSVISHLAGREVAAMCAAANAGDYPEARRLHQALLPLARACFLESNPAPVKGALSALWEPVGVPRLPLLEASSPTIDAIEAAMKELRS
jgi:4-hydroxy-tetrahydrodipicolinate synthase